MEQVAPLGPAYQAGTMAGNPASMAAGIACLEVLQEAGDYEKLEELGERLEKGIMEKAEEHNVPITVNRLCSALTVYFSSSTISSYEDAEASDGESFAVFFKEMLNKGINLAPSKYEAWFLTTEHSKADIDQTIEAVGETSKAMKK